MHSGLSGTGTAKGGISRHYRGAGKSAGRSGVSPPLETFEGGETPPRPASDVPPPAGDGRSHKMPWKWFGITIAQSSSTVGKRSGRTSHAWRTNRPESFGSI